LKAQDAFPHLLSDAVIEQFNQEGFIATPEVFSATELQTLGHAVDDEVSKRSAHDTREVGEKKHLRTVVCAVYASMGNQQRRARFCL
jgi:hypothetical protein